MPTNPSLLILNRLASLLDSSLLAFSGYAKPWQKVGEDSVVASILRMAEEQQAMIDRIADALACEGYSYDGGEFPMEFTALFDLSLSYLLAQLIESQEKNILSLRHSVEQLEGASIARALAAESLGLAEGHLENLREFSAEGQSSMA